MKKEEKRSSTSRWNDTSSSCIIYRATEEEKSVKGLKDCQKDYSSEEREL